LGEHLWQKKDEYKSFPSITFYGKIWEGVIVKWEKIMKFLRFTHHPPLPHPFSKKETEKKIKK
jgi:hypothetical protein